MKRIIYIIVIVNLFACGSRKKSLDIQKEQSSGTQETKQTQKDHKETNSESTIDYAKLLQNTDFKIIGNGNPFQLQYGDFIFSGNADLEFSTKKEDTKAKIFEKTHTFYKSETTFWSKITYKTVTYYKTLRVESTKPMFWLYVLVYVLGILTPIAIYLVYKYYVGRIKTRENLI